VISLRHYIMEAVTGRAVFGTLCTSIIAMIACIGCESNGGPNSSSLPTGGGIADATVAPGTTGGTTDFITGTGGATGGIGTALDSGAPDDSLSTGGVGTVFDSGAPDGVGATSVVDASGGDVSTGGNDATVSADAVPSVGCVADSPLSGSFKIDVQGTTREYVVKVPDNYDSNTPYRLVFAWHGLGGTASMTARGWFGLEAHAANSAIFIAGQAQGQGMSASWAIHPDESDMDYTRAMLEWAKANYCIDTGRVFSIGVSNGGMMSNIVGCELGDLFRAIAVIAGGGPQGYATTPCKGQVAVWITHGNQDNNVPFSYGERSRDYWTGANHCRAETMPAPPDPCIEFQGCDDGFPVQFCEHDGGHTVPSFTGEAAWNFFARL
jgi:polyhydroxybutyrate depolymerase